jgi:hypothetical protein
VSLVLALASGCGGSDDRPDLEAASPPAETTASTVAEPDTPSSVATTPTATAKSKPLPARQQARITAQATDTAAALERWNAALSACISPSGEGDDPGATCTKAAWELLFDAMDVEQYELLRLLNRIGPGACHETLVTVLDAVHGFLAGATPTNVVWLDEQQQPPSRFDLEAIVDLVRPVPARMRDAAETTCRS